jgi:hypothetical protein
LASTTRRHLPHPLTLNQNQIAARVHLTIAPVLIFHCLKEAFSHFPVVLIGLLADILKQSAADGGVLARITFDQRPSVFLVKYVVAPM